MRAKDMSANFMFITTSKVENNVVNLFLFKI